MFESTTWAPPPAPGLGVLEPRGEGRAEQDHLPFPCSAKPGGTLGR